MPAVSAVSTLLVMNMLRVDAVYLKPGDFCIALRPTVVKTVLGSCVTVTMYSARTKIGAACHALLPTCREDQGPQCSTRTCQTASRYVECIIPEMARRMQEKGMVLSELEIKLFGGADMMMDSLADHQRVGSQNVLKSKMILARMGMTIKSSDVGGGAGRKLIFDTRSGDVWIKRLATR